MSTPSRLDASAKPNLLFELGNMKIRTRIFAGFGALIILGAGLAGYMLAA